MKKVLSLVLIFVICLSLCACGDSGPHPLSVDFQTEEELITALEEFFSSDWSGSTKDDEEFAKRVNEIREVLKNNTAIHHYFQKSDEAVALAHRLCDNNSIGGLYAELVFDACNTTEWYAGIAQTEDEATTLVPWPLFFTAWSYDKPTFTTVADAIRDNFKDPLSVSVLNGEWSFIKPVDGYFEGPLKYVGIVEVRATNSFGGYETQKYVIEGKIRGDIKLIEEYNGSPFLGVCDFDFYERYNAQVELLKCAPFTMEAENTKKPLT